MLELEFLFIRFLGGLGGINLFLLFIMYPLAAMVANRKTYWEAVEDFGFDGFSNTFGTVFSFAAVAIALILHFN